MRILIFVSVLAILTCLGVLVATMVASARRGKTSGNSRGTRQE